MCCELLLHLGLPVQRKGSEISEQSEKLCQPQIFVLNGKPCNNCDLQSHSVRFAEEQPRRNLPRDGLATGY